MRRWGGRQDDQIQGGLAKGRVIRATKKPLPPVCSEGVETCAVVQGRGGGGGRQM